MKKELTYAEQKQKVREWNEGVRSREHVWIKTGEKSWKLVAKKGKR